MIKVLISRLHLFIFLTTLLFSLTACNKKSQESFKKISQGEIIYTVTYPYFTGSKWVKKLLPNQIKVSFTDKIVETSIKKGNLLESSLLINNEEKTAVGCFSFSGQKFKANFSEGALFDETKEYPKVKDYIFTNEVDTIAGVLCHKVIVVFSDINWSEITLWYTDQIRTLDMNWCTPYEGVQGVLLAYDINRLGLTMRLKAKEIVEKPIDTLKLNWGKGIEEVNVKEFNHRIEEFFSDIIH